MHLLHGDVKKFPTTGENGHKLLWSEKYKLWNCVYDPINNQKYIFVYVYMNLYVYEYLKTRKIQPY